MNILQIFIRIYESYLISVERGTHLSQFFTDGIRAGRIIQVSMDEGVYKADASVRAGKNQIAE